MTAQSHEAQPSSVPHVSEWTAEQWQGAVADVHEEADALLPTFMPSKNVSTRHFEAAETDSKKPQLPPEAQILVDSARRNPEVARLNQRKSDTNITPNYVAARISVLGE